MPSQAENGNNYTERGEREPEREALPLPGPSGQSLQHQTVARDELVPTRLELTEPLPLLGGQVAPAPSDVGRERAEASQLACPPGDRGARVLGDPALARGEESPLHAGDRALEGIQPEMIGARKRDEGQPRQRQRRAHG